MPYIVLQYTGVPEDQHTTMQTCTESRIIWSFAPNRKYECAKLQFRQSVAFDACNKLITNCKFDIINKLFPPETVGKEKHSTMTDAYEWLECLYIATISSSTISRYGTLSEAIPKRCRGKFTKCYNQKKRDPRNRHITTQASEYCRKRNTLDCIDWIRDVCNWKNSYPSAKRTKQTSKWISLNQESSRKAT